MVNQFFFFLVSFSVEKCFSVPDDVFCSDPDRTKKEFWGLGRAGSSGFEVSSCVGLIVFVSLNSRLESNKGQGERRVPDHALD